MNFAEGPTLYLKLGMVTAAMMLTNGCQFGFGSTVQEGAGDNWAVHGGTNSEQRYSQLSDIDENNVKRLGIAWTATFDINRGQEATPIVIDGVMYVTTAWSKVLAFDAATGRELWRFDPQVPGPKAVHACCDVVNRGVAVADGKVFFGTIDGRLIALDAKNGKQLWSVQTFDPKLPYTITGAPRIAKGKVLIGNGGADLGVRGFVTAYRISDGGLAWRFYTVPGNPTDGPDNAASDDIMAKAARSTWFGKWWEYGGGGTVWDSIVYDPELDQVYIGVGNGSPWNRKIRSDGKGDNLFLASIVALDPDTGKYRWHYQESPGETWDFTATQQMTLADLTIDGKPRKVLMQAPKNGFFYVLDRTNGRPIRARPFVPINWAKAVDLKTGRPIEAPNARFEKGTFSMFPAGLGAHSWNPMSYSPKTGLVYIPALRNHFTYSDDPHFLHRPGRWNMGVALSPTQPTKDGDPTRGRIPDGASVRNESELIAWDPVKQKAAWRVRYPTVPNGGTLATAGNLVFQGTFNRQFQALRATDGKPLWTAPTGANVIAGAVTYRVKGVQYVAVVAGAGGAYNVTFKDQEPARTQPSGRLLVFKLDGTGKLPPDDSSELAPPSVRPYPAMVALAPKGAGLYFQFCMACHGGIVLPDLRRSAAIADPELFHSIVIDGVLQDRGMASFKDYLTDQDAEALRAFLTAQALELGAKP